MYLPRAAEFHFPSRWLASVAVIFGSWRTTWPSRAGHRRPRRVSSSPERKFKISRATVRYVSPSGRDESRARGLSRTRVYPMALNGERAREQPRARGSRDPRWFPRDSRSNRWFEYRRDGTRATALASRSFRTRFDM